MKDYQVYERKIKRLKIYEIIVKVLIVCMFVMFYFIFF